MFLSFSIFTTVEMDGDLSFDRPDFHFGYLVKLPLRDTIAEEKNSLWINVKLVCEFLVLVERHEGILGR